MQCTRVGWDERLKKPHSQTLKTNFQAKTKLQIKHLNHIHIPKQILPPNYCFIKIVTNLITYCSKICYTTEPEP